jgi:hypothetical protein
MVKTDQNPVITTQAVVAALEMQRHSRISDVDLGSHADLLHMQAVNEFLNSGFGIKPGEQYRPLALEQLLSSQIIGKVNSIMQRHAYPDIPDDCSKSNLLSIITKGVLIHSKLLVGYLWLYAHYCRYDLGIERDEFCVCTAVDRRTLHRYQSQAISDLTGSLLRIEFNLRLQNKKLLLHEMCVYRPSIPQTNPARELLHYFEDVYRYSHVILIYGPRNSGKTYLASQYAHHSIDTNHCTQLVWIQSPESYEEVIKHVHQTGNRSNGDSPNEPTLFIIDGADKCFESITVEKFSELVSNRNSATFLFTCRKKPAVAAANATYIPLLSHYEYLTQLRNGIPNTFFEADLSYTSQLEQIAYPVLSPRGISGTSPPVTDTFNRLQRNTQSIIVALCLLPNGSCLQSEIDTLLVGEKVLELKGCQDDLSQMGLVHLWKSVTGSEAYTVDANLRVALMRDLQSGMSDYSPLLESIMSGLIREPVNRMHLLMIENILLGNLVPIVDTVRERLIDVAVSAGIQERRWMQWAAILENSFQNSHMRRIAYAFCCVGMGKIHEGVAIIGDLVSELGRCGKFTAQERALAGLVNEDFTFQFNSTTSEYSKSDIEMIADIASLNYWNIYPLGSVQQWLHLMFGESTTSVENCDAINHARSILNMGAFLANLSISPMALNLLVDSKHTQMMICDQEALLYTERNLSILVDQSQSRV